MSKVLGLDLGTGNSCVAVIENGNPTVIVNEEGTRTTPSVVQISKDEIRIGNAAKRAMVANPKNTVSFIKRFMGAEWNDNDVQKMLAMTTYDVVDNNGKPYVKIDDKEYSPEQISSMIISKMKKVAEDYVGEEIKDAVITVPAWFGDAARSATKVAGELAGLNVLRVIAEPTAAALAANLMDDKKDKTVVVVDSGCGTVDVSVLELSEGMAEVLASNGDVFLGGQNYDNAIVDWVCDEYMKTDGVDLKKDKMAYARVVEAAEKAKVELSSSTQTEINLPYISMKDGAPLNLCMSLSRAKFESLVKEFNDKTVEKAKTAIKKANKNYDEIDCILLVGGTTRIPSLQEALKKEFGRPLNQSINPDEAVALGAAKQAGILAGDTTGDILLLDVTPLNLGLETKGGVMTNIVEANTTIPCQKKQVFTTSVDNQPVVEINVLQGNRIMAADNKSIAKFKLDGIPMAKAGIPQIEVTFDIDANGILTVTAKDLGTDKKQNITISDNSLSDEEINRIKADAEKFKAADEQKKKDIDTLNSAEGYAYSIENALNDNDISKKISDDDKVTIKSKLDILKEAISEKDYVKINTVKSDVENSWNSIFEKIYKENAQSDVVDHSPENDEAEVNVDAVVK